MKARQAAVAAAAGAGAVYLAARRIDAAWRDAHDPCAPEDYLLPEGTTTVVETDDGASLAVTDTGQGPTVVLAHCWTGAREVWAPVAHRLLRSGHRVVMYDQRGHGSSTTGRDRTTIERLGADLRAVIEAVDARDAVVAGHSMGGMTVMAFAVHHPDVARSRARHLVVMSTAAGGVVEERVRRAAPRVAHPLGERLLRSAFGHAVQRRSFGRSVSREHLVRVRDLWLACPGDVRVDCLLAMADMDLVDGLRNVEVPATVLVGTDDRLTPLRFAEAIAEALPRAELRTLEGFGHWLPFEAPDEVASVIAQAARGRYEERQAS